jgi:tetratricopeptide (TPR) repeat protein
MKRQREHPHTTPRNADDAARKSLPRRRTWLFRIVLMLAPFLVLALIECSLRMKGRGYDTSAILCRQEGLERVCYPNDKFGYLFFPPAQARSFSPFRFPATKPPNTCRIFVIGESAAQGFPDPSISLGRVLDVMLRRGYPAVKFEVITVAMSAVNSHAVRLIAEDCARYQPDLFIVYAGNNEVIGPYGPGSGFTPLLKRVGAIRFHMALQSTRLLQVLGEARTRWAERRGEASGWLGMETFSKNKIASGDPALNTVYRNFRRNLEDICKAGRRGGARVILATVGSNLKDCPPFASLHAPELNGAQLDEWQAAYQRGVEREAAGRLEEAGQAYTAAENVDATYAELPYRLARLDLAAGRKDEALLRYAKARDLDALRFRSDTLINGIIRDVAAAQTGVRLLDAVQIFAAAAPDGIPGAELFSEHVHMTFNGNYLLAKAVFNVLPEALPAWVREAGVAALPPDEAACAAALANTKWDEGAALDSLLNGLIIHPPFTGQMEHAARMAKLQQQLRELELLDTPEQKEVWKAQYRDAIAQAPADWWLHMKYGNLLLSGRGEPAAAEKQFRDVARFMPGYALVHAKLGMTAGMQGNLDRAITECSEALRLSPYNLEGHQHLGLAYQMKAGAPGSPGESRWLEKAIEQYRAAIRIEPRFRPAYQNLGAALVRMGHLPEAMVAYQQGLQYYPQNAELHFNLAVALSVQGHKADAMQELRRVLELKPEHDRAKAALRKLEGREGKDSRAEDSR